MNHPHHRFARLYIIEQSHLSVSVFTFRQQIGSVPSRPLSPRLAPAMPPRIVNVHRPAFVCFVYVNPLLHVANDLPPLTQLRHVPQHLTRAPHFPACVDHVGEIQQLHWSARNKIRRFVVLEPGTKSCKPRVVVDIQFDQRFQYAVLVDVCALKLVCRPKGTKELSNVLCELTWGGRDSEHGKYEWAKMVVGKYRRAVVFLIQKVSADLDNFVAEANALVHMPAQPLMDCGLRKMKQNPGARMSAWHH